MGSGATHLVVGTVGSVLKDLHAAQKGVFTKTIIDPKGYVASSDPGNLVRHIVSTDNDLDNTLRDQILASVPKLLENRKGWMQSLGLH